MIDAEDGLYDVTDVSVYTSTKWSSGEVFIWTEILYIQCRLILASVEVINWTDD